MKKFLIFLLTFILSITVFSACGPKGNWVTDVQSGTVAGTAEFGKDYLLPKVVVKDENGNTLGGTTISILTPDGQTIDASYGVFYAEKIGTYLVSVKHGGLSDFNYKIECKDLTPPTVTMVNAPEELILGNEYNIPSFICDDEMGINYSKYNFKALILDANDQEQLLEYDTYSNCFIASVTGVYIFRVTVYDNSDNCTIVEKKYFVKDPSWFATDLTENVISTFDSNRYLNTISDGISAGNISRYNSEDWLSSFESENGVVKITSKYDGDGAFEDRVSFRLKFPTEQALKAEAIDGLKIKMRTEDVDDTTELYFLNYYQTENVIVPDPISLDEFITINNGEWTDVIINGAWLDALADSNGDINGLQIMTVRDFDSQHSSEIIWYLAEITTIVSDN